MAEFHERPALMLVLHDVAPSTWADYRAFVEAVDRLGNVPMTWLVVPDFHRHDALEAHPDFCRMLDQRVARGDELALHGHFHEDTEPGPRTAHDWFMRRIYTHEGEFYQLSREATLARLRPGIDLFRRHDWPLHGFVAPAWLMSAGTRQALRELPLRYTSDPQRLYHLPEFTAVEAPGLVWSARSAWRRGMSKFISEQREQRWRQAPVIRLGLHPVDMRHRFSRDYWWRTLERLLADGRVPMTKIDWLTRQRTQAERAA
ncbi:MULTISPECIES: polysaccharide deacetylase family protein [Pseudomonas]|uniref:Polysaccharide deacetylase family protein n=1 Tax=Pseudomonas aphyarum TaxID=2942629 RepID=A0ABT5PIW3_9PSED|nr:polysaccharide deacetylase family protein [Pseudomonas aphyarum]MDD0970787.1 polysaccharide deacetylase family protein [Pseudomonas aphyarum]MDD1123813.1 polysaccharide deacetylase family protein [Pseudomonas aphyarum]